MKILKIIALTSQFRKNRTLISPELTMASWLRSAASLRMSASNNPAEDRSKCCLVGEKMSSGASVASFAFARTTKEGRYEEYIIDAHTGWSRLRRPSIGRTVTAFLFHRRAAGRRRLDDL